MGGFRWQTTRYRVSMATKTITHGIISSFRPLRNRIGILVILGIVSSVGQIWWQSGVRKRAGGKALLRVSRIFEP